MDSDKTTDQVMQEIELNKLQKEYEEELQKYEKNKFISTVIKKCDVDKIEGITEENKTNIKRAIIYLHLIEYGKMENTGLTPMGISIKPNELSYIEKKALNAQILIDMPKFYDPQLNFINSVSQDVFRKKEIEQELCDLECKRKDLIKQVADVKLEHCDLLKKCAEMKFNSYQKNSAELIQINAKIDQVKAGIIQNLIENNITGITTHASKAIKQIEGCIDAELAKSE